MLNGIIITRKNDGLIFCEVMETDNDDRNFNFIRNRAQEFLKIMQNKEAKCTVNIDSQKYVFHYIINENVVYLAIADKIYSQKLAFCFLNEINERFSEELKNHFGTQSVSYYSKLETIDRANYFIKFEKTIKKIRLDYLDSSSESNVNRLNKEIKDVQEIMADNIKILFERESGLNNINKLSQIVTEKSDKFRKTAYETRIKMLLSKYSIFIAIGVIFILLVVFKICF